MLFVYSSANVSPSISARPESRWAMHAGSCTAWSTVSSLTDRCPVTRQSEAAMTRSTRSSVRREQGNTFQEPCLSTWSPLLLVSRTINRRMTFDRKLTCFAVVKKYTGCCGYIHWSTKSCTAGQRVCVLLYSHQA